MDVDTRSTIFTSAREGFEYTRRGALDAVALYALDGMEGEWLVVTGSRSGWLGVYICGIKDGRLGAKSSGSCIRNGSGISNIQFVKVVAESESNLRLYTYCY